MRLQLFNTLRSAAHTHALLTPRQLAEHSGLDRTCAVLLVLQWIAIIAAGSWVTSARWSDPAGYPFWALWVAILLGGAAALAAVLLVRSGARAARYVIAATQVLLSSLLIQVTEEGIDSQLYVLGSLALLSLYTDWRVFVPAAAAFVASQVLRHAVPAQSVLGFVAANHWTWADYCWVLLAVAVLVTLCVRAERAMRESAHGLSELETNGQKYRALLARSEDGICLLDPATKQVLEANEAFCRLFRHEPHTITRARPAIVDLLPDVGRARGPVTRDCEYRQPDGPPVTLSLTVERVSFASRDALCIVVRDVTEHRRAEAALKASEERFELAARGTNDGLWDWDFQSGRVYLSPRWSEMLGLPHQGISHVDTWLNRLDRNDHRSFNLGLQEYLDGKRQEFQHEHRIQHADGTYRWMLCRGVAVLDTEGRPLRMVGSQTDVTDRRAFEEQLDHAAFQDTLTGLANRTFFSKLLSQAIARAGRESEYQFAVLFVDLDRFKIINDSLGHLVGDELLKEVAWRLQALLRAEDVIARFGGDEFTVLLDGITGEEYAAEVAARIRKELDTPFTFANQEIGVTASIGIALSATDYANGEDLLRNADIAMYRAKSLGKNRHETFDAAMHHRAVARLTMESDIRRALEWREFSVYYQPIVSAHAQMLVGFEALVRWTRRNGQSVPPSEFIPVAEETGLIVPLGHWVLNEACRQVAAWQSVFPSPAPLSVAVNLSTRELEQTRFVDQVAAVIHQSKMAPGSLHLELTERSLLDGSETNLARIRDLKALSVQLYLDDFGTGYSSLSYLHRFPMDVIKIDQSFIQRMEANIKDDTLVGAIITLAKKLGMEVVAEGVETASQLQQLKTSDCDCVQGYFFGRPQHASDIEALLHTLFIKRERVGQLCPVSGGTNILQHDQPSLSMRTSRPSASIRTIHRSRGVA